MQIPSEACASFNIEIKFINQDFPGLFVGHPSSF